ncbi:hypothetical protein DL95DRAFT_245258, partial [Leptodontidium sp. 2 PMI_412]
QEKLRTKFIKIRFILLKTDNYVYINRDTKILIVTYVNNFLVIKKAGPALKSFKTKILTLFKIVPTSLTQYFL